MQNSFSGPMTDNLTKKKSGTSGFWKHFHNLQIKAHLGAFAHPSNQSLPSNTHIQNEQQELELVSSFSFSANYICSNTHI